MLSFNWSFGLAVKDADPGAKLRTAEYLYSLLVSALSCSGLNRIASTSERALFRRLLQMGKYNMTC